MKCCRKKIIKIMMVVSAVFLTFTYNVSFAFAEEDSGYTDIEGSGDETLGAEIPVSGKVTVDDPIPEKPNKPDIPTEPEEPGDVIDEPEIPSEPVEKIVTINKGFSSISEIDTGDRQRWDYYKQIFLVSGIFLVVLAMLQLFKKQEVDM